MNNEKPPLRVVERTIVSAVIISSDGKFLLGEKDPDGGGVYPGVWHIPGGGIKEGETFREALIREVKEETNLEVSGLEAKPLPRGKGESEKTLETGEKVLAKMVFNRFELRLHETSDELSDAVRPCGDLMELRWFSVRELNKIEQVPGGEELFRECGYL